MTDLKSLSALIGKSAYGPTENAELRWCAATFSLNWRAAVGPKHDVTAFRAYQGSLDAAKALHEALLPEWSAMIWTRGLVVLRPPTNRSRAIQSPPGMPEPARAWLLAIVRALIAEAEARHD